MNDKNMLKFSKPNAKTRLLEDNIELKHFLSGNRKVYSFDLLSGINCPGAYKCKSRTIIKKNGRKAIKDSPSCEFRCFSASQEAMFPGVYNIRKYNTSLVRGKNRKELRELILNSIPKNAGIIRLHVSGDFFSRDYLLAWYDVAKIRQDLLIYTYTKSLHLLKYLKNKTINLRNGSILDNFLITASRGGKFDDLISKYHIRSVKVVYDEKTKLPIDHDDSHCATKGGDFALLIHGIQPTGSKASKARIKLGTTSTYSRKRKK